MARKRKHLHICLHIHTCDQDNKYYDDVISAELHDMLKNGMVMKFTHI